MEVIRETGSPEDEQRNLDALDGKKQKDQRKKSERLKVRKMDNKQRNLDVIR